MLIFTFQKKQEIEETKKAHEEVSNELAVLKKQNLELLDQEEISIYYQIIEASMLFLECQVI